MTIYDALAVIAVVVCVVLGVSLVALAAQLWVHRLVQDWRGRERARIRKEILKEGWNG
jgi:hypothetical protein